MLKNGTGSATGIGPVQVNAAMLGGTGKSGGALTVGTSTAMGILAPGIGTTPGTFTVLSKVTFAAASSFKVDVNSSAGTADKLVAKGVTIKSGAQFFFSDHGSGTLSSGTVLTLISNTATTAISGRFINLADGLTFTNGTNTYQVSYHGGDGNDLTLTVQ